jgi:hypothetical protein
MPIADPALDAPLSPWPTGRALLPLVWGSIIGLLVGCTTSRPLENVATDYTIPIVEGLEEPPPGELRVIRQTADLARDDLLDEGCEHNEEDPCCADEAPVTCWSSDQRPRSTVLRDAHAKHHGCVLAQWEADRGTPDALAHGVFASGVRHTALIRYSNGNPTPQPDQKGDGRGMAIKLMGVPGPKLIADEAETQDFLLINHPVFFIRDAEEYLDFQRANSSTIRTLLFFAFDGHGRRIARTILGKSVSNPLEIRYHSMTPYLIGSREGKRAVKYEAVPIGCDGTPLTSTIWPRESDDFLREAMVAQLGSGPRGRPACFDFYLVPRPAENGSVEDATVAWPDQARIRVARITIGQQSFDSAEQRAFCEQLSYTPWHALPVHQPIGGLNRLRLDVYREISSWRHRLNRIEEREPTASSWAALLGHPPVPIRDSISLEE